MTQIELTTKKVADIGEDIGIELGAQMVKAYQAANPNDVAGYTIGKNIIESILSQPGCVGIRFYHAIDEDGKKTLVYMGVDEKGENIINQIEVNNSGKLKKKPSIVADRTRQEQDSDPFSWLFDWITRR